MQTEFEVSVRLIFWGDDLEPVKLAKLLDLNPEFCTLISKGEIIKKSDNGSGNTYAKTGMLTYTCNRQYQEYRHDPEKQLDFIKTIVTKIPVGVIDTCHIEQSQLQIFIFYENHLPGEANFLLPYELMSDLCKHNIKISLTVLP